MSQTESTKDYSKTQPTKVESKPVKVQGPLPEVSLIATLANGKMLLLEAIDEIQLSTYSENSPGKLTASVYKDVALTLEEGCKISLFLKGVSVFESFLFERKYSKSFKVDITCYDILRYLKNKDILIVKNKSATDILKQIATAYGLPLGAVEDTKYVIPKMRSSNEELFATIQKALANTLTSTGKKFLLLVKDGKICLQDMTSESLNVPILLDAETLQNYEVTSSIDKDTYNTVKLYYDDKKNGVRSIYVASSNANIARWGLLQTTESLNNNTAINPIEKAKVMLSNYNSIKRTLRLTGCAGDIRVQGGSNVWAMLSNELDVQISVPNEKGEIKAQKVFVQSVTHHIQKDMHTMDIIAYAVPFNPDSTGEVQTAKGTVEIEKSKSKGTSAALRGGGNMKIAEGLSAGSDAWLGARMDNGTDGCVEAAGKIGSYYSPFLASEAQRGIYRVDTLVSDAQANGIGVVPFSESNLEAGDVIVYDNEDHVVIASGGYSYIGNSSRQVRVVSGSNFYEMNGMTPTKIIKTSRG